LRLLVSYLLSFFKKAITKGAEPTDLLVKQPTKFELIINVKTAKPTGLTIAQSVLYQAIK